MGLEEWGKQQTGQEFHWAPRGRRRVQEGFPIGQEESVPLERRRERQRQQAQPTSPSRDRSGTRTGDSGCSSRPPPPFRTPEQWGKDVP